MATIKVACPRCGQKVSGDESFFGTTVECPICSSSILFPGEKREGVPQGELHAEPAKEGLPPKAEPAPEPSPEPIPEAESASARPKASTEPLPGSDFEVPPKSPRHNPDPDWDEEDEGGDEIYDEPPSPMFGAISIVSAVIALVTCGIAGPLFAPLAIIFGHTALAKAKRSPVHPAPGQTLGAIGLMIGYVSLLMTILVLVLLVFFGDSIRGYLPAAEG